MAQVPQIPQAIVEKYMTKQPIGFCNFLAQIGAVSSVDACIAGQRAYLQSKDALGHWLRGLTEYGRIVAGMAGVAGVR